MVEYRKAVRKPISRRCARISEASESFRLALGRLEPRLGREVQLRDDARLLAGMRKKNEDTQEKLKRGGMKILREDPDHPKEQQQNWLPTSKARRKCTRRQKSGVRTKPAPACRRGATCSGVIAIGHEFPAAGVSQPGLGAASDVGMVRPALYLLGKARRQLGAALYALASRPSSLWRRGIQMAVGLAALGMSRSWRWPVPRQLRGLKVPQLRESMR